MANRDAGLTNGTPHVLEGEAMGKTGQMVVELAIVNASNHSALRSWHQGKEAKMRRSIRPFSFVLC